MREAMYVCRATRLRDATDFYRDHRFADHRGLAISRKASWL
jgi:hypothetical protein